ncbi:LysR family transcriptional regulator [Shewanella maritima]|uniref:LysR family transcriptional regulator n=1 Tax=Shewanella maritima TaxID=2520507 RepID=UPI003734D569
MELKHLRHFIVLAQQKSFSRAATKLNLAQPSLSRSIQKMEDLLGVTLLDRGAKGFTLTEYGELVFKQGELIVSEVNHLKSEIDTMRGIERAKLVVGASPIPSNSFIGPIVGLFLMDHPNTSVELKVNSWDKLYRALNQGSVHIFVAETGGIDVENQQDLEVIPLPKSPAVFCCRKDHPLTKEQRVYLPQLKDFPIAVPRSLPTKLARQFDDLFDADREDFSGMIRFDQFHPIKESLQNCDMLVITPKIAIQKELNQGSLVALDILNMPDVSASFSIVYSKKRRLTRTSQEFIAFLNSEIQQRLA